MGGQQVRLAALQHCIVATNGRIGTCARVGRNGLSARKFSTADLGAGRRESLEGTALADLGRRASDHFSEHIEVSVLGTAVYHYAHAN